MRRVGFVGIGILVAVLAFAVGLAFDAFGSTSDVTDAEGPWTAVTAPRLCEGGCTPNINNPGELESFAEAGDPDGLMISAINIIAKLDRDGCEWNLYPLGTLDGPSLLILYRC